MAPLRADKFTALGRFFIAITMPGVPGIVMALTRENKHGKTGLGVASATVPVRQCRNRRITERVV